MVGSPFRELQIQVDAHEDDFKHSSTSRASNTKHSKPTQEEDLPVHKKSVSHLFEFYKTPRGNSADVKDVARKQNLSQEEQALEKQFEEFKK